MLNTHMVVTLLFSPELTMRFASTDATRVVSTHKPRGRHGATCPSHINTQTDQVYTNHIELVVVVG